MCPSSDQASGARGARVDAVLRWALRACAGLAGVITALILVFLVAESIPALRAIGVARLVTDSTWRPDADAEAGAFGLLPMVYGTIAATVGAVLVAALGAVPAASIRGAAALGLTRWATVRSVALPVARGGIGTGVLLGTGRALGETMAVLMVCGNVVQAPSSLFDPIRTLTANIALEMGYAAGDHRAALFASGLVLMLLVVALVVLAEWASRGDAAYLRGQRG